MNTMALYLIGDVQGCDSALQRLLDEVSFSASRDTLYMLGDLVNRGPASDLVLRRLMRYGATARCLLGNHDLHLLAVAHGARKLAPKDTLHGVLQAPDRSALLEWLRQQHLALREEVNGHEVLMVHAGVLPPWSSSQTMALAHEVETVLRGPGLSNFLHQMYGNEPRQWSEELTGAARLRVVVNSLTRLRYCDAQGRMEFESKEGTHATPKGYLPWFDAPGRQTASITVAFGHWSTLRQAERSDILPLDTGCVWGGCLSAVRLERSAGRSTKLATELIQVKCEPAQAPG